MPLLASIKLTYRCNLRCAPCPFHSRSELPRAHMSWDTAVKSIVELKRMGCLFVVFEGGEPLLWSDGGHDFSDLALFAKKHFITIGTTTNGTLGLDVPTDILWVSLDGLKNTHDKLRSNSFDRVISNIKSSTHKKLFVHYTFNHHNLKDFEDLCIMLTAYSQVKGITVQFYYPYNGNDGSDPLALTPDERRQAIETVLRLKKEGFQILNSTTMLKAMVNNTWRCHEWLLANVEPDGKIFSGCYVKGRGQHDCRVCGFTPVAEASGAYDFFIKSIISGLSIFFN